MNATRSLIGTLALLTLMAPVDVRADEPNPADAAIQELFGERLAATARTSSAADDVKLFDEILKTTAAIKDEPAVYEAACHMAIERLGKKPGGYDTAVRAINALMKMHPKKWEHYIGELITVREHQTRFGNRKDRASAAAAHVAALLQLTATKFDDDSEAALTHLREAQQIAKRFRLDVAKGINEILESLAHIEREMREIERLKDRLKANPDDTATAKKLVLILMLERNDPDEARKYAFLLNDEAFVDSLKLSTRPLDDVDKESAAELSAWFEQISDEPATTPKQKKAALVRAITYGERYLTLHKKKDLDRVKAEIRIRKLKQAAEQIADAGPAPPPLPPAIPRR